MEIAKQIAGFSPAEADDLRKAIGKKIHSLMASLKSKFLEGCAASGTAAGGRAAALGGHGAGAGLLVQQVARRLLRADLLPHRLAAREPPARVHGGAHLLGDEHEGQGAVLRRRVRRARDRGAAARRERVAGRLRGRRGQDPLRAERREERRRGHLPRDRRGARGGRAVRVDLGLHRARRPVGRRTSARSSRSSSAARSTRPARRARGCSTCSRTRSRTARGSSRTGCSARRSIFDLGDEPAASARHHATIPRRRVREEPSCCGWRRRASASTSPSIRSARSATSSGGKTDCTLAELERRRDGEIVIVGGIVAGARARRRRRRASRWRSSSSRT